MPRDSAHKQPWKLRPVPAPLGIAIVAVMLIAMAMLPRKGLSGSGPQSESKRNPVATGRPSRSVLGVQPPAARKITVPAASKTPPKKQPVRTPLVVLGFNDLGMHCMNQDDSELCILPPFNNLHAQVIDRRGDDPQILTSGVKVAYQIPGNTFSAGKTNFWTFAPELFGVHLPPNIGLTGNGLSGTMTSTGDGDYAATGIPLTPITDHGALNPYQLSKITASINGKTLGSTQAVVPVSWEISCNLCHNTPGMSVASDILTKHDKLHQTNLMASKPVLCASCHADPALNSPGKPGVSMLSHAMHGAHANRFTPAVLTQVNGISCYACHPGIQTHCQRDVHFAKGITCTACHGGMANVGNPTRTPWVSEPRCDNCHNRPGFQYEQPGMLYKVSKGHHGVKCASCHGSPHAITPTVTAPDNVQAISLQGHPGTINDCRVCHKNPPDDGFDHRFDGADNGEGPEN